MDFPRSDLIVVKISGNYSVTECNVPFIETDTGRFNSSRSKDLSQLHVIELKDI